MTFVMNGFVWKVIFTDSNDPALVDRTGLFTLGVTDPLTMSVHISKDLDTQMMTKVLIHELGHCAMVSYGLIDDIHKMVKKRYWIEAEELICNLIANHGEEIFETTYRIVDDFTLQGISNEFSKIFL